MALETIDLNPTPRIQTLCLLDLPPEILHIIVGRYDNHNARRLGSTCRYLHTISRSYIYKVSFGCLDIYISASGLTTRQECMIALSTQWINSKKFGGLEASNMLSVFDDGLSRAKEALIENTQFLQSHLDIQKSVTNLTIIDRWDIDARNFSSVHADTHKHSAFYSPIYKAVYDLIPHFVSLKVLVLSQWYLSKELLNGLRYLSHLHTIEVASCVSVIHTLMHPPQLNSLRTLVFHFIDEVEVDSWVVLSMCPDVENLTVSTPKETKSWQLTPAIPRSWQSLNPFKTLRNYSLSHIASTFVPVITLWLLNASRSLSNQHLPLTHLKIELEDDDDLPGPMMFNLLDGLAGTSLESLVLIGIQYTEPDIFDRIGRALPNLQELTLCCGRRVNYDREYLKRWSRPAWEYPSHFLSFRKLHYLSWNIAHPDISYFSRTMLYFEQDQFPGLDSWDFGEDSWDEGEIVAKSIRAYNPSLRCMVLPSSLSRDTYRCVEVNGELSFAAEGFRMRLMQS